jgi:phage FluMu protein Com
MPIRFRCDYCGQLLSIAARKAGATIHCPKCQHDNTVPTEMTASSGKRTHASRFFESSRFDEWIGRLSEEDSSSAAAQSPRPSAPHVEASISPVESPSTGSKRVTTTESSTLEPWLGEPEKLPARTVAVSDHSESIDEGQDPSSRWVIIGWATLAVAFLLISFGLGVLVGRYGIPASSG